MKFYLLIILTLISVNLFSQNYNKQISQSESLMTSVLNNDIFKTYFKLKDVNSDHVQYDVEVDGKLFKSINLFFDSSGNLKSNKYLLREHKHLSGFILMKKLKPKMSFLKQFKTAKKSGLSKIDNFKLFKNDGNLYWFFYENYTTDDKRNGCLSIKIDDNGNAIGGIESVEEFYFE